MLNIITEHDVHKNYRVLSLASYVTNSFSIYKISENGDISKKLILAHEEYEDYDLYKDCGRVLYQQKGFARNSDRAIRINDSNYVNFTKHLKNNKQLLAIRNNIFVDDIIQNPESSDIDKEICIFIYSVYDIIKLTNKGIQYSGIITPFKVYKTVYENEDLTISLQDEFQCFTLFNNSWIIDKEISNPENKFWKDASKYMSRVLNEDVQINNLEELQYYMQIYETRIY